MIVREVRTGSRRVRRRLRVRLRVATGVHDVVAGGVALNLVVENRRQYLSLRVLV